MIYGPRVTVIKSNLEDYLETASDEEYVPTESKKEADSETKKESKNKSAGK